MPTQNDNLKRLEQELLAYCEVHSRSSKSRKIRALFNTIQYVIDDGLSLDHIVSFLSQNDIPVSKNTLKVYLYRIRKERGNKSTVNKEPEIIHTQSPVISKNTVPSSSTSTKESVSEELEGEEQLQNILDRYYSVNGLKERYEALGGDIEDFKGKSISDQRQLVNNLKAKITRQLRV
ncbi:TPA: hypothetical protein KDX60_004496 [Vibrio parahaemolyticus]|nr:hypothetical protein [Vibrio parahaemolyticus]